jgi:hypothetical protein
LERPQEHGCQAVHTVRLHANDTNIGSVAPSTLKLETITSKTAKDVPSHRRHDFTTVQGEVLIVNPSDKKIVDVITGKLKLTKAAMGESFIPNPGSVSGAQDVTLPFNRRSGR